NLKRCRCSPRWDSHAVGVSATTPQMTPIRSSWRNSFDETAELIFDMHPDDLIERLLSDKAQPLRALCIEVARPAFDDPGDHRIGLMADELDRLLAGGTAKRLDLLADRR